MSYLETGQSFWEGESKNWAKFGLPLTLFQPGFFYNLFQPGGGGKYAPPNILGPKHFWPLGLFGPLELSIILNIQPSEIKSTIYLILRKSDF